MPKIKWNVQGIPTSDPYTRETKFQVQKIIDLQNIKNNLPDIFTNVKVPLNLKFMLATYQK